MQPRVTLAMIAAAAGLSRAAVSMALRRHPRISRATQERVAALAERMGYRPDPEITRLTRYLRTGSGHVVGEVLGLVNNFEVAEPWASNIHLRRLHDGLVRSAAGAGFRLENFWMAEPRMTPRRMARILKSRGVNGLVFLGFPRFTERLDFPFEDFATVTLGHSLAVPMHRVSAHQYREMLLVLDRAAELGYRRPGLVLNPDVDRRVEGYYRAAFAVRQLARPPAERVDPLLSEGDEREFKAWFARTAPDLVIVSQPPPSPRDLARWMAEAGRPVPDAAGLVLLDVQRREDGYAGIVQAYEQLADSTVDVLQAQLMRGLRGLPASPQSVKIAGDWVDGASAPPRRG